MSGCGLPVALQNKFKLFPSTTSLSDGAVTISGGTTKKNISIYIYKNRLSINAKHLASHGFFTFHYLWMKDLLTSVKTDVVQLMNCILVK